MDGHHIKHWSDGGETSLDNLVLLCRHHHHLWYAGDRMDWQTAVSALL
ncbi:MAG: HNH endonuclease [Gammaproteobacteria bacterium]|nr:HNH endonuclease [Gammaproteobacteria bacterium]